MSDEIEEIDAEIEEANIIGTIEPINNISAQFIVGESPGYTLGLPTGIFVNLEIE